jgi:hypothetical protein
MIWTDGKWICVASTSMLEYDSLFSPIFLEWWRIP